MRWLRLVPVRDGSGPDLRLKQFVSLKLSFMVVHVGEMLGADEHEASRRMKSEIFTQVCPCCALWSHSMAGLIVRRVCYRNDS